MPDRRYRDPSFLERRYVQQRDSASDIAADCGVTSSTVSRWLDRHGIEREPRYEDPDWLRREYVERGRRQQDIAEDCDVTKSTISHWLGRHGITDGTSYERAVCATCEKPFRYQPTLRDGTYCSNDCANEQRKKALERDDYQCVECGISNAEHKERFGRELDVHHKIPVREFAKRDLPIRDTHSLRNLVTYCRTHHPDSPGTTVEPD